MQLGVEAECWRSEGKNYGLRKSGWDYIFRVKNDDNLCDNASDLDGVVRRAESRKHPKEKQFYNCIYKMQLLKKCNFANAIVTMVGASWKVVCGRAEWRGKRGVDDKNNGE